MGTSFFFLEEREVFPVPVVVLNPQAMDNLNLKPELVPMFS
jgi:hypothetical protein